MDPNLEGVVTSHITMLVFQFEVGAVILRDEAATKTIVKYLLSNPDQAKRYGVPDLSDIKVFESEAKSSHLLSRLNYFLKSKAMGEYPEHKWNFSREELVSGAYYWLSKL